MGGRLATSAKINKARDANRARSLADSSFEDSDALVDNTVKSKWLLNKSKANEEKKQKAIEYRAQLKE